MRALAAGSWCIGIGTIRLRSALTRETSGSRIHRLPRRARDNDRPLTCGIAKTGYGGPKGRGDAAAVSRTLERFLPILASACEVAGPAHVPFDRHAAWRDLRHLDQAQFHDTEAQERKKAQRGWPFGRSAASSGPDPRSKTECQNPRSSTNAGDDTVREVSDSSSTVNLSRTRPRAPSLARSSI